MSAQAYHQNFTTMEDKQSEKEQWEVIDLSGGEPDEDEKFDESEGKEDPYEEYDDEFDEDDYPDDDGRFDAYV